MPRRPLPRRRARARRRRALRRRGRPGWRRCSSTSSRRASTRATRPACSPAPRSRRRSRSRSARSRRGSPRGLGARGLINLQLALTGGRLYVLEANPRASRTVPFVAKATGVPLVEHAVRLLLGEPLAALDLPERATPSRAWAKEAVFPAERFPGAATRGPEMRSTGEVMAGGATPAEAYARALRAAGRSRRGGDDRPAAPGLGAIVGSVREILEAIERGERRGRAGRRRDGDRHDPLGAAPARRQDGGARERPVRRLRLGRLCRGRRRRAREADLRRRGRPPRPLRRHRRRGLGGRALLRRRDRRLGRAGRPRFLAARCGRSSTRTATGCSHEHPHR